MLGRPFTCKQRKRREEKIHQGRERRPLPQAAARPVRACRREKHEERPEESDPYIFGIYQDHVIVDGPPYEEWEKYDEPDLF